MHFLPAVDWPDSHPELQDIAQAQLQAFLAEDGIIHADQLSDAELLKWCSEHEHLRVVAGDVTSLFCGGSSKTAAAADDAVDSASAFAVKFHSGDEAAGDAYAVFIHDIRVSPSRAKGSGYSGFNAMTDDRVYADHALVRERIPRGLAFLQVCKVRDLHEVFSTSTVKGGAKVQTSLGWRPDVTAGDVHCLLRGLRKFTGRDHGDDDDTLPGAGQAADKPKDAEWQRFFTSDPSTTTHVAAMEKANGESGHFTALATPVALKKAIASGGGIAPDHVYVGGSKTVHIIAREAADLEHPVYASTRYSFARNIVRGCLQVVQSRPKEVQQQFKTFMATLRITLCIEFLNPATQHVERFDFSHPVPQALTFVSSRPQQIAALSLGMHPIVAVRLAQYFGFEVVGHSLHSMTEHVSVLQRTRYLYGKEGYVLYYMNGAGCVIGLVKRKSVWYIIQRAVREKARSLSRRIANICEAQRALAETAQGGTRASTVNAAAALTKLIDTAYSKASKPLARVRGRWKAAGFASDSLAAAVTLAGSFAEGGDEMHPAFLAAAAASAGPPQVLTLAGTEAAAGGGAGGSKKGGRGRRRRGKGGAAGAAAAPAAEDASLLVSGDFGAAAASAAIVEETKGAAALMALRLWDIQSWLNLSAGTVAAYSKVVLNFLQDVGRVGPSEHRHLFPNAPAASAAAGGSGSGGSDAVSSTLVPTAAQAESAAQRVQTWLQDGWQSDLLGNRFPQMMSVFLEQRGINDNIDPIEASAVEEAAQ